MYRRNGCTGETDVQEKPMYMREGCIGETDVQEKRMYRRNGCTGETDVQEGCENDKQYYINKQQNKCYIKIKSVLLNLFRCCLYTHYRMRKSSAALNIRYHSLSYAHTTKLNPSLV